MTLTSLLTLVAAVVSPMIGTAAVLRVDLDVEEIVLENGLTLLVVDRSERPYGGTVAAGWVVRAGSRDDPPGRSGLAHLVEHALYGGSGRLERGELPLLYARAGATGVEGRTFEDFTWFTAVLPADQLELWFWLESDRLLEPRFDEAGRELDVVLQERRQTIDARPVARAEEALRALHWREHPYGAPAVGRSTEVESLRPPEVEGFFLRHYEPSRLVAVLVGEVDAERARTLGRRYFGRLPGGTESGHPVPTEEKAGSPGPAQERRLETTCACPSQVRILYRTVAYGHTDAAPLGVVAAILNGRSGRLYEELVANGAATSAWVEHRPLAEGGEFLFVAELGSTGPDEVIEVWDDLVAELESGPLAADEVERAARALAVDSLHDIDGSEALMRRLLVSAGLGGWELVLRRPGEFAAVTPAAVRRVVARYLGGGERAGRTVGVFLPPASDQRQETRR